MMKKEKLENILQELAREDLPANAHQIAEKLTQTFKNTPRPTKKMSVWRIIMKSKLTRYAAAAVIVIGVMTGLNFMNGSPNGAGKVYAMSDVPKLFSSARNIYMKVKLYFPESGDETNPMMVEVEHWLDIENERWRSIKPSTYSGPDGFKLSLTEKIADGGDFELNIDRNKEEASFAKISQLTRKLRCRKFSETIMTLICGDPQLYDLYKNIGTEVIDGHTYNIWELTVTQERLPDFKMQAWLSPQTGDFAKGIIWLGDDDDGWKKKTEIIAVEQNITMPDELFAMEVPEGYQLTNTRQTANDEVLFGGLATAWNSYMLMQHRMFSLPDGSVIACWSSWDKDSKQSQAELFGELEFGGDFPKLPYEIYALETNLNGQKEVLQGRHLCTTEHDGNFYEWGVYVPRDRFNPQESQVLIYTLVYRTHIDAKHSATLGAGANLHVRDMDDFNIFVLGTMAQFSDDGIIPEGITYDRVMALVEEIRLSLKN